MNNFNLIKQHLKFESDDSFYHVQVLKRKKENPELGRNSRLIKTYYINTMEQFEREMGEIKLLCDYHNARAYINLNRRSFEKVAKHMILKLPYMVVLNEEFYSVRKAYESVCGGVQKTKDGVVSFGGIMYDAKETRTWVIDYDEKSTSYLPTLIEVIDECDPKTEESKVKIIIPTKNGYHLITKGFNVQQFKEKIDVDVDIQKNNPTMLYMK